jgi:3-phenylpropionate/trans-cinnamate dioxygenase ferredoxin reductase subunit
MNSSMGGGRDYNAADHKTETFLSLNMSDAIVVAGAGQAAAQLVDSLRREGFGGPLVVVGEEPYLPYQRPPLSKKFLAGELDLERLFIRPASFYQQTRAEMRTGVRVTVIDRSRKTVTLSDGGKLEYAKLVLAIGSQVRRIRVPGADLDGVYYLRAIEDVHRLRAAGQPGKRLVVVGAGYIGLEVAATCRHLGVDVTVVEALDRVMSRVVAPVVSQFFAAQHAAHGVRILCGAGVKALEGNGRVETVVLADGGRLPADFVVVGIGIQPVTDIAQDCGLTCDNGIVADAHCRTSDPDIFTFGDCASFQSERYGRRVRLESVDNAFEHAKTAAAMLVGKTVTHDKVPWFWSDQYDLKLLIVGLADGHDEVVLRGDPTTKSFSVCYLKGGELLALDAINHAKDYMAARKLIAERIKLDPAKLADSTVALKDAV